jgi:hypothetical protein
MKNIDGSVDSIVVIEKADSDIIGVKVFPDTEEGLRDSEIFFFQLIKEANCDLIDERIEGYVKEGVYVDGDYMITSDYF